MRTVQTFYGITADISEERVREASEADPKYLSTALKLERFVNRDSICIRAFLQGRGHKTHFPTIRMLEAHGCSDRERRLMYLDGDEGIETPHPVNEWLDSHEGKYDVLFVACCNEDKIVIEPKKSILIYPLGIYAPNDLIYEVNGWKKTEILQIIEAIK